MKPLIIGVGAPKAGTTWLATYLGGRSDCSKPPMKEMSFFTSRRSKNGFRNLSARIERRIEESEPRGKVRERLLSYKALIDSGARSDAAYLSALMDGVPKDTIKYDITPAYALLGVDTLREIYELTDDVRFVYLMRDPIDRLWSQARHRAMSRSGLGRARVQAGDYNAHQLSEMISDAEQTIRSDLKQKHSTLIEYSFYSKTIERLKCVAPDNKIFFSYYENLFSQERVKELCQFFDLPFIPASLNHRVSYSFDVPMSSELHETLKVYFAQENRKVSELIGELPAEWGAGQT